MLAYVAGASGSSKWQQDAPDVSDPSDWVGGSFAFLKDLDASLRCEICSDIIRAPVSIKRCHHTFCSRCIRDYINQPAASGAPTDRPCPNCRQPKVYDSELVPVPQLEVAAEAWRQARPALSRTAQEVQQLKQQQRRSSPSEDRQSEQSSTSSKRRRVEDKASMSKSPPNPNRRVTRSATGAVPQRSPERAGSAEGEAIVVDDDESGDEWKPQDGASSPRRHKSSPRKQPANGPASPAVNGEGRALKDVQASDITECPMCCHTFTLLALNRHLDTPGACKGPGSSPPTDRERGFSSSNGAGKSSSGFGGWFEKTKPGSTRPQGKSASSSIAKASTPSSTAVEQSKLKRPQYHLLSEQKLRKLCDEYSLTTSGSRQTLESRHRRWIDIYNANLDASPAFRRTEGQLRREIKEWDREREKEEASSRGGGAGGSAGHGASGIGGSRAGGAGGAGGSAKTRANVLVGASEEERRAYTVAHASHFRELIAQSRKTHAQNKRAHNGPPNGNGSAAGVGGAGAQQGDEGSAGSPRAEEARTASPSAQQHEDAAVRSISAANAADGGVREAGATVAQEQSPTQSEGGGAGAFPAKAAERPAEGEQEQERDSPRNGLLEDMGDFFEESMEY